MIDAATDDREAAGSDHGRMRTDDPALCVRGLTKRYGKRVAVDGVSFEVPSGVTAGFIGPNGAGKTTTLAMLLGLVRPPPGRRRCWDTRSTVRPPISVAWAR
jgi:ABC-type multidrug transport system ATPase subunit